MAKPGKSMVAEAQIGEIDKEVPFSELAKYERKPVRRRGRPPKSTRRKHATVYLTAAELEELGALHTQMERYFPVARSELVGVAISLLNGVVERGRLRHELTSMDLETFRSWALSHADFLDLKNHKIGRRRVGWSKEPAGESTEDTD